MRYMLLIYGPEQASPSSDEEMLAAMAPWNDYSQWLRDSGQFVAADPLAPISTATTVRVRDGKRQTVDGPFAETKEVLGGYYIVAAPDLDTALEAAARCPGAEYGSIEIRPIPDMPAA